MKRMALVYLLFATTTYAADGTCVGRGKAGQDAACYSYGDTDEATCLTADGIADCAWVPAEVRGTGPIRVKCEVEFRPAKVYYTNSAYYDGATKSLTLKGFGPNRQDDGFAIVEGNCSIEPPAKVRCP